MAGLESAASLMTSADLNDDVVEQTSGRAVVVARNEGRNAEDEKSGQCRSGRSLEGGSQQSISSGGDNEEEQQHLKFFKPNVALRMVTLPFVMLFISCHAVITIVLIDSLLAIVTMLLSVSGARAKHVLRVVQTRGLEIWMTPLIGFLEHFGGLTMRIHGERFVHGESALVVVNHRSWVDSVALYCISRQTGAHGALKFFAKKPLLLFPVYGLAGHVLNVCIFITRTASHASRKLRSEFAHLTEHLGTERATTPFWMVSYLEGTRRTAKKVQEARAFALERGLQPLTHVLQPRVKGFVAMATELRPAAHAVYDITLGYSHHCKKRLASEDSVPESVDHDPVPQPEFSSLLFDYCRGHQRVVHVYQRRIPMADVPEDEAALREFVYALYRRKDELLEEFENNRQFPEPELGWMRITLSSTVGCFVAMGAAAVLTLGAASKASAAAWSLVASVRDTIPIADVGAAAAGTNIEL